MQLENILASLFLRLGAVRCEVTRQGVATWWRSSGEAHKAKAKLSDMGLLHAEVFSERTTGLWACLAKTPFEVGRRRWRRSDKPFTN